jgi:hypothetical protein
MNTFKTLTAAAALMLAAGAAQANQWYVANMGARTCDLASHLPPDLKSPFAFEQATRKSGQWFATDITRDETGTPSVVEVGLKSKGEQISIVFFRELEVCKETLKNAAGTAAELQ